MKHHENKLKILTWHIHGTYLYYLSQCHCEFFLPVKPDHSQGYGGRSGDFPWGKNVHEIPSENVKNEDVDLIIFQSKQNYLVDQYDILSPEQRTLPQLYLEHDPPRLHPTDTRHLVTDLSVPIVHVTHFNNLMFNNASPTYVVEHGVIKPSVEYSGERNKGIVVINNLALRGRRLGLDVFLKVRKEIPLDIVGINSEVVGGLGEVQFSKLAQFISRYRFFFSPIRYTSLGLSIIEAMMVGLPVVGLATTELATVIKNGETGFIHTDVNWLVKKMKELLVNPSLATSLSKKAKQYALKRFNITRFTQNWQKIFASVITNWKYGQESAKRLPFQPIPTIL